jgi:hypothetical protein
VRVQTEFEAYATQLDQTNDKEADGNNLVQGEHMK